ncbi:MAG: glycosyltransferase [Candidatus Aminicenantes bacterium]|nr:glycosyltransferase [Candidatus Aminicenantes bacterium]
MLFLGRKPDTERLKKRISGSSRVRFLGRLSRKTLPDIYSAGDVLICLNDMDSLGWRALEAQACGLPVVVSKEFASKEGMEDKVTYTIEPGGCLEEWPKKSKKSS